MGQYLPVVALAVLAAVFGGVSRIASKLLAPSRPTAAKRSPYESGIVPGRETIERFPVRFYLIAMSFIVFDIEVIFLYPWAVLYRALGGYGLLAILLFAVPVVLSLVYEIAHGALEWGPSGKRRPVAMVDPARTSRSTIRLVGSEGRLPAGEEVVA